MSAGGAAGAGAASGSAPGTAPVAAVGLGSNLGDSASTLRAALDALDAIADTRLLRASRLYRTPPWGRTDQPEFVNAVALLETGLSPRALLDALLGIEQEFGRDRDRDDRWGPRTLDLDLLLFGDADIDEPGLRVPHPHLAARAFVLLPLAEIAPGRRVPGRGRVSGLLAAVDASGCVPLAGG